MHFAPQQECALFGQVYETITRLLSRIGRLRVCLNYLVYPMLNHRLSVAPMLDWTDRHYRYFARLISPHALLYTEMVTSGAILFGGQERHLAFDKAEHPVALQLGGSDPNDMARCAQIAEQYGYDEININVGCPSDRVQNGAFGACLMGTPEIVADVFKSMQSETDVPVTVKHRIGIDDQDSYHDLENFVAQVAEAGCSTFVAHARKAWLKGLSPKENRDIPPLEYERVYQLKQEHPDLTISINGGIKTYEEIDEHLKHVDGVMIGRESYHNPYMLAEAGERIFGDTSQVKSRAEVVMEMIPYIESHLAQGGRLNHITRHMLGLFHAQPGARQWRRVLSENASKPGADIGVLLMALESVLPSANT